MNEADMIQKLLETADAEIGRLKAENAALREVARGVVLLQADDGGRRFPSKSLIQEARAVLARTQPA
jgi:hypothetical protein